MNDNHEYISLPNGSLAQKAIYCSLPIAEYNSNPLIRALQPLEDRSDIVKKLTILPQFSELERNLDGNIRIQLVHRLYSMFQPLPIHLEIWETIMSQIRQGYVSRNPFNSEYVSFINNSGKQVINGAFDMQARSNPQSTASCATLIGISGIGKTTLCNNVFSHIPQIIVHSQFEWKNYDQIQVPWLKLEAPHNSSLKSLCLQFFAKVDELIGTDNYKKAVSRNLSIDSVLPRMGILANNIKLGMLIIDEIQVFQSKGSEQMMNFLVSLINTFRIPILLIGTPACYSMITNDFRIARRVSSGAAIVWNNMDLNEEFRFLLESIWCFQWTRKTNQLSDDIIAAIYDATQGVTDLIIKLFVNCQIEAIQSGKEVISVSLVNKIANEQFKLMKPMLAAIESKNPYKIMKYQDIKRLEDASVGNSRTHIGQEPTKAVVPVKQPKVSTPHAISTMVEKRAPGKPSQKDDLRVILKEGQEKSLSAHQVLSQIGYLEHISSWVTG